MKAKVHLIFHRYLLVVSLAVVLFLISGRNAWPAIVIYWIILSAKNLYELIELMKG